MDRKLERALRERRHFARKSRREGLEQQSEDTQDPMFTPTPTDIRTVMSGVTKALRGQLVSVGEQDPWILERGNSYELAVGSVLNFLTPTLRLSRLGQLVYPEIWVLAKTLEDLFNGQLRAFKAKAPGEFSVFEGYFRENIGNYRRLVISQRTEPSFSARFQKTIADNCEITIKEVLGRSARTGGAIAGNDSFVRCSARAAEMPDYSPHPALWQIIFSSGETDLDTFRWKSIGPLSQAIDQANKAINPDCPPTFTYVYRNPATEVPNSVARFRHFNQGLNSIFLGFSGVHRTPEPTKTFMEGLR